MVVGGRIPTRRKKYEKEKKNLSTILHKINQFKHNPLYNNRMEKQQIVLWTIGAAPYILVDQSIGQKDEKPLFNRKKLARTEYDNSHLKCRKSTICKKHEITGDICSISWDIGSVMVLPLHLNMKNFMDQVIKPEEQQENLLIPQQC